MSETYKKITYDSKKVQVESAIRDGEGVKISTNYAKKSELADKVSYTKVATMTDMESLVKNNGDIIEVTDDIDKDNNGFYLFTDSILKIASISCSTDTTWVLTTDGKLYGCGRNNYGQQGDGTTTNVTAFTQRLSDKTITDVMCSPYTTWAVTTDGKLYGCGRNNYGQQGDGTTTNVTSFTQRLSTETIASVVCSDFVTWALTTDGKLYGCGRNNYGLQGDGTTTDVTTFTQRLSTETIKSVACSGYATWALITDGKLYGCGRNYYGEQGDGTTTDVMTFTQRLSGQTIANVRCTIGSTWALTTDEKLFGCGINNYGQQGDGTTTNVKTFTQRLSGETIASVSCSTNTTWALTTDGKLYGCGHNLYGQQGDGTTTNVTTFTQRLSDETVANLNCSTYTTWALTTDGKLFGCGYNNYGGQGNGTSGSGTNVTSFTQRLGTVVTTYTPLRSSFEGTGGTTVTTTASKVTISSPSNDYCTVAVTTNTTVNVASTWTDSAIYTQTAIRGGSISFSDGYKFTINSPGTYLFTVSNFHTDHNFGGTALLFSDGTFIEATGLTGSDVRSQTYVLYCTVNSTIKIQQYGDQGTLAGYNNLNHVSVVKLG